MDSIFSENFFESEDCFFPKAFLEPTGGNHESLSNPVYIEDSNPYQSFREESNFLFGS